MWELVEEEIEFRAPEMKYRSVNLPDDLLFPEPFGSETVVGLLGHKPSRRIAAYDLYGACLWEKHFEASFKLGTISADECWLMRRRGVIALGHDGSITNEIDLALERGERLGSMIHHRNSVLVSIYRTKNDHNKQLTPRVIKVSRDGEVLWSSRLPVDKIAYRGVVEMTAESNWQPQEIPSWRPETWLPCGADQLLASSDRVLASFQEMPRSGIGCRYVLDFNTGKLVWKSRATPIANARAIGYGRLLIGDQGYGAFETQQYKDGEDPPLSWKSHGHYVALSDDRVLCIEMSNDLSVRQRVVELLPKGRVKRRSRKLVGYYTSKPVLLGGDRFYFWRANNLWQWSDANGLESMCELGLGEASFADSLSFSATRFGLNVRNTSREPSGRIFALFELPGS